MLVCKHTVLLIIFCFVLHSQRTMQLAETDEQEAILDRNSYLLVIII